MGTVLLEDLQREIEAGSVIAIVGVGVSVAVTNNSLLLHGADFCITALIIAVNSNP
jgi:hypothetical protein